MYYNKLSDHLKNRFGCKVYKLSLSCADTCPNRDGTLGTRGCIFCKDGSGAFAETGDVNGQIERAKLRVSAKHGEKFIAYFQSYTSTYAPTERLREAFSAALDRPDIVALSVATRPDCLEEDKLALLAELARKKPVTVELGLQTVHERTARYIRRGYKTPVYFDAVRRLKEAGLEVVTHVILFLPGESEQMMLETVKRAGEVTDGIKLQLLHVLRGTDLEKDYLAGGFSLPDLESYVDTLEKCVSVLPPRVVIHRLTGDGDKRDLVAPLWTADKKRVLNRVNARFERDNVTQGSFLLNNVEII